MKRRNNQTRKDGKEKSYSFFVLFFPLSFPFPATFTIWFFKLNWKQISCPLLVRRNSYLYAFFFLFFFPKNLFPSFPFSSHPFLSFYFLFFIFIFLSLSCLEIGPKFSWLFFVPPSSLFVFSLTICSLIFFYLKFPFLKFYSFIRFCKNIQPEIKYMKV